MPVHVKERVAGYSHSVSYNPVHFIHYTQLILQQCTCRERQTDGQRERQTDGHTERERETDRERDRQGEKLEFDSHQCRPFLLYF